MSRLPKSARLRKSAKDYSRALLALSSALPPRSQAQEGKPQTGAGQGARFGSRIAATAAATTTPAPTAATRGRLSVIVGAAAAAVGGIRRTERSEPVHVHREVLIAHLH